MKIALLSVLLLIGFSSYAQDDRLFEQPWYLHDLIIEGQSNVPPVNSELDYVLLTFTLPLEFHTAICNGTNGYGVLNFNGTTEFSFIGPMVWLAGACTINENMMFTNMYQGYWSDTSSESVQYEIMDNGQDRMLTVTAFNGDQAIYGNAVLSTPENKTAHLQLYPNPVTDILNLIHTEAIDVLQITIYDFLGRKVLLKENDFSQIDLGNLKAGMYFISVETTENEIVVRRIIKN